VKDPSITYPVKARITTSSILAQSFDFERRRVNLK